MIKLDSRYDLVIGAALAACGFIFAGSLSNGIESTLDNLLTTPNLIGILFLVFFPLIAKILTFLLITGENVLEIKILDNFWKTKVISVRDIYQIERYSANTVKSWGSMFVIRFRDENGEDQFMNLYESYWSISTIRTLLKELQKRNPDIKLDDQYIQFLNGEIDDWKFRRHPADK